MAECILKVSKLIKRYGDLVAVDSLDLEVKQGEMLGFLGPNGAGKTTSLKMMCGLLKPDSGHIEIKGERLVAGVSRGLQSLGVAPQNIVIWDTLTCLEQLEFIGRMYNLPPAKSRNRAKELLTSFGLEEKAHRLGRTLSGGMQRRLNIALGLVHEPEILFLDEPQAGLDPQSRVMVREYIQSLGGQMTVIITTHDMEEAEKLADRVCIIDRGRLLVTDTVTGLKRRFADSDVFEITAGENAEESLRRIASDDPSALTVEGSTLVLPTSSGAVLLAQILQKIEASGIHILSVQTRQTTLEDVFIRLTGRRLRE